MLNKFEICDAPDRFNVVKLVSQVEFLSGSHWDINDLFLELSDVKTNELSQIKLPFFHGVFRGKLKDVFYISPMLNFQVLVT